MRAWGKPDEKKQEVVSDKRIHGLVKVGLSPPLLLQRIRGGDVRHQEFSQGLSKLGYCSPRCRSEESEGMAGKGERGGGVHRLLLQGNLTPTVLDRVRCEALCFVSNTE